MYFVSMYDPFHSSNDVTYSGQSVFLVFDRNHQTMQMVLCILPFIVLLSEISVTVKVGKVSVCDFGGKWFPASKIFRFEQKYGCFSDKCYSLFYPLNQQTLPYPKLQPHTKFCAKVRLPKTASSIEQFWFDALNRIRLFKDPYLWIQAR